MFKMIKIYIKRNLVPLIHAFSLKRLQKRDTLSNSGYLVIEYTNVNKCRGVQFVITSHLEPVVLESLCRKWEVFRSWGSKLMQWYM